MSSTYLPLVSKDEWDDLIQKQENQKLHDLIVQPLHEELYRRQSFDFIDELSEGQQMFLAFDYVQAQVSQGGFIQFIQNHYISLLLPVIQGLKLIDDNEMITILDDVLKVYVLNRELLDKETNVNEFAALYNEFKEFEALEERYNKANPHTTTIMLQYAIDNPPQFVSFWQE